MPGKVQRGLNNLFCFFVFWIPIIVFTGTRGLDIYNEDVNYRGLFPNVFNLASSANITVNATCGESGPEVYCKLVEHVYLSEDRKRSRSQESQEPQCRVCDASQIDKAHPITFAIDGTNKWWQSPTLQNGKQYEWVTITLDLRQIYQVAYVIVKAAISPRPGNWILERSLDSIIYKPWQYYAISDSECWEAYGIRPTVGKPHYRSDDEVICTSFYSKLDPLANGEIHASLINGRPGVDGPSDKLREFTKARYIRLRLQKIRTLHADLMTLQTDDAEKVDKSVTRRYFYSIKDISVGGQCMCSGHALNCSSSSAGKQLCVCKHRTCGENCEKCCPLYNQKAWRPGTSLDAAVCEKCQCYGHSDQCHFDPAVADKKLSINIEGKYEGGGVCDNCKHHTTGNNCEQCEDGYFRPSHILRNHTKPCKKCQCSGPGMTGSCVKDDSHLMEGLKPGDCLCKVGFDGKNCDRCAIGYRNYPLCDPCPCHSAGTIGGKACEGECVCKVHVEGPRCDRCKPGYYHLSADNPDGCSQCFCFGITDECTEGNWGVELIQKVEDWRVTDLKGRRVVKPTLENGNAVVANDDMAQFSTYYWLAPPDYLGKKLYSYGADLKFTVSYVVARGDTSGTYTESSDVILEGNGMQLGYNWAIRPESDAVSITMPLREHGWFILSPGGEHIGSVSRETFTLVLNDLTRLLIRAKFHTDQIEGRLHNIGMETASKESKSLKKMKSVEKCLCPQGYTGLSCELCAPGYRQIKGPTVGFICERCDCYNHAEFCDADTGRCRKCMHHTTGPKCDFCVRGYYGNATVGTPDDCKRCACPLEQPENNFSPTCTAVPSSGEYICDQCPLGYEGNKCERCINGYFGNPQVLGGYCQPCECSGNADTSQPGWCDSLTGQCLKCLGNTSGWNCGECLPNHYGSSEHRQCKFCSCDSRGSVSPQCDQVSGQCVCKPHFIGRTCDRCEDGYGNVEAGCVPCRCNPVGSRSVVCDSVTGSCFCKPGVFGIRCDSCLEGHYGFSEHGCRPCNCHLSGSTSPQCEENNGYCSCKPHVAGRECDRCEDGYWNLNSGIGCEKCQCNVTGSVASLCDKNTGQCNCKPGVGGKFCDQCLPGHFKFSSYGCRQCDPCDVPGHICDPNTGRCICPPYTTGRSCQKCVPNAWGYDPINGCKPCNCNPQGSPGQKCDARTGNCVCLEGFEGRHCDQCRHGFYNFPNCHKCDCNTAGTDLSRCQMQNGVCQCNERGSCFCKENVIGQKCDQCKEDAFGLSSENTKGCHECFCFGRTRKCNQASMFWAKKSFPSKDVFMEVGTTEIPLVLGFQVIPDELPSGRLGIPYVLDKPLYWSLPKENLGDMVLSYNGYLQFHIESHSTSHFPDAFLQSYPLLILQGNHRIVLMHSHSSATLRRPYQIKLHEDKWKHLHNPQVPVKKSELMVALQNVQTILIRSTDGPDVKYSRIYNISMDVASSDYHNSIAEGVEACHCPRQYTGLSCQDPAPGYYRKRIPNYLDSKDILDLVGWAEPCLCYNHTNTCDKETGICINCGGNTVGEHCDHCVKGYYGEPKQGPCRPCACPRLTNSFSDTCIPDSVDYVCVDCQQGYDGRHCERCARGYYGDPLSERGRCVECNCNPYGSRSRDCDPVTGQCECNEGIGGRDCTICSHGFILTEYGCKSCEDECTGVLLNELYQMKLLVDATNLTDLPRLPWGYLSKMTQAERELRPLVDDYQKKVAFGKELVNNFTFYFDLETQADLLLVKANNYPLKAATTASDAKDTLEDAEKLFEDLNKIWRDIKDLTSELNKHGLDPSGSGLSTERMLREAERILREIKNRDFISPKNDADRELRKAQNLLDSIRKLIVDGGIVGDLKQKIDVLNNLLGDIVKRINDDVRKPTDRAFEISRSGRLRQNEVQGALSGISNGIDTCNATLVEAADLLGLARSAIIEGAIKFEFLPRRLRELENATDRLDERRSILAHLNPLYHEKYVVPAQEHADELERQSLHLSNLFKGTKAVSEFPLQAAKAYQNIIDAIFAAEKAAQEASRAAEKAYRQAYPVIGDALTTQARDARARSLELLAEAQKLSEEGIPDLEEALSARKKEVADLAENIAYSKRTNDIINKELDELPKGIHNSLENANRKAKVGEKKANDANEKVMQIVSLLENDLKPRFEAIHAGTVGGLENLTKIIQQAREDIRGASRLADNADASASRVRKQNAQVRLDLKELKDKILLARQKASSIRVALTADDADKCRRSYLPRIEPSTTNNIVLNYAIKSDASNSLLFFMGSVKEEDFMAIEMVNRKIRFLWNAGGGTQMIQHNMTIETNNEQLLKAEQWFKIEANRIGNIGTLSVKRTPDGKKTDPFEASGVSPAGFSKMDLDSSSDFFIGGFPDNYLRPSEIRTSSFAGCLYEVVIDGRPVGLWNFLSSIGCDACKEGATEEIDTSAYEFQGGTSYAIASPIPYYRKTDLFTVLNFKTLNEDGLLFLASNPKNGHFMSLELNKGKVVYQLKFGDRAHIFLETKNKYNTGQWTRVEAAREKFEAQFLVEEEYLEERYKGQGSSALDLQDSPLYYGGIPPNFTTAQWPQINFKSFFGCMKDLQIDSTPVAFGSFYGMSSGCSDKPLKSATFSGTGFLELNSHSLSADSSFSFSFLTHQSDALLLLSTFSTQVQNEAVLENYYSVALKSGRIEARFNSGSGEISMTSDRMIRSGVFHSVNIIKKNRRLILRLDDEEEADIRLPKGPVDIKAPKRGGLYFGGVKEGILVNNMAASQQHFSGIIQNAIFNNRLLNFEDTVGYKGVDFGFVDVKSLSREILQQMPIFQLEDSCAFPGVEFDNTAVSFSSNGKQFLQKNFEKRELTKNFNITFEIRPQDNNGILVAVKNDAKLLELIIYLENSLVTVDVWRKRQHKTLLSNIKIETWKWHKVSLIKSSATLSLFVNGKFTASENLVKKLPFKSPLYIGGSPKLLHFEKAVAFKKFSGCIRNLHINGILKGLNAASSCFKNAEAGAYFSGKGYTLYSSKYNLGEKFIIKFDFRTVQLNGILMHVHSIVGKFHFKLEVIEAQILATIYQEASSHRIQLSRSLTSKYEMCSNSWHSVVLSFDDNILSLKLDDLKPIDKKLSKLSANLHSVTIHFGGSPRKYQTESSSNFIGCIRRVFINGAHLNLQDAENNQNVHYSCPVV